MFERYLGARRVSTLGRHDLELYMFRIEVKEIETWAGMKKLHAYIEQAVSHAPSPYIPALLLHVLGNTPAQDWAVIPVSTLKALLERST